MARQPAPAVPQSPPPRYKFVRLIEQGEIAGPDQAGNRRTRRAHPKPSRRPAAGERAPPPRLKPRPRPAQAAVRVSSSPMTPNWEGSS
jgi:hypothetical protein